MKINDLIKIIVIFETEMVSVIIFNVKVFINTNITDRVLNRPTY